MQSCGWKERSADPPGSPAWWMRGGTPGCEAQRNRGRSTPWAFQRCCCSLHTNTAGVVHLAKYFKSVSILAAVWINHIHAIKSACGVNQRFSLPANMLVSNLCFSSTFICTVNLIESSIYELILMYECFQEKQRNHLLRYLTIWWKKMLDTSAVY